MLFANTGEPKKSLGNTRLWCWIFIHSFLAPLGSLETESISRFKRGCGLTLQPANECLGLRRRRCVAQLFWIFWVDTCLAHNLCTWQPSRECLPWWWDHVLLVWKRAGKHEHVCNVHLSLPSVNQPHQNRSPHHNHGTAEDSFTQNPRFGHRSGWSPCAHSIGKFFLWLIVVFFETSAPGLPGSMDVFRWIWVIWGVFLLVHP